MGRPTESKKLCTCVDLLPWGTASGESGSGCQERALSGLGAGRCHRDKRSSVGPVFGPLTLASGRSLGVLIKLAGCVSRETRW